MTNATNKSDVLVIKVRYETLKPEQKFVFMCCVFSKQLMKVQPKGWIQKAVFFIVDRLSVQARGRFFSKFFVSSPAEFVHAEKGFLMHLVHGKNTSEIDSVGGYNSSELEILESILNRAEKV